MFFLKTIKVRNCSRGSSVVELALSFPVVILIIFGTVHIGAILNEANIIAEASRYGARSTGALSGNWVQSGNSTADLITWINDQEPVATACHQVSAATTSNSGNLTAISAACNYLVASGFQPSEWQVISSMVVTPAVLQNPLAPTTAVVTPAMFMVRVRVEALDPRGPVDFFKRLLNIKPGSTSTFPLEVLST